MVKYGNENGNNYKIETTVTKKKIKKIVHIVNGKYGK